MSSHRRGVDPGPGEAHSHALAPEDVIRFKVKAELRKRIRGVRKTAPLEACAARSVKIVSALESLAVVTSAKSAALFWPIVEKHEVDLRPFDAALRARGVRVAYPSIDPDSGDMVFRFVSDPRDLAERGYGFEEPSPEAPVVLGTELDIVIVPAIAVDPVGHRIGYGAGYYDRTLPKYAPPAVAIAVVYDYQLIAEVPTTEGDVAVAWVVTDERVIDVAGA